MQPLEARRLLSNQPVGPVTTIPRDNQSGFTVVASSNRLLRVHVEVDAAEWKTKVVQWYTKSGQPESEVIYGRRSFTNFSADALWAVTDDEAVEAWQESDRTTITRFGLTGSSGEAFEIPLAQAGGFMQPRDVALHDDGRVFILARGASGLELAVVDGQSVQRIGIDENGGEYDGASIDLEGDRLGIVWRNHLNRTLVRAYDVSLSQAIPAPLYSTQTLTADLSLFVREVEIGNSGQIAVGLWNPNLKQPLLQVVGAAGTTITPPVLVSSRTFNRYAEMALHIDSEDRIACAFCVGSDDGDTFLRWYDKQASPLNSAFVVHDRLLAGGQVPVFIDGDFEQYEVGYMTAFDGSFQRRAFDRLGTAPAPTLGVRKVDYDNGAQASVWSHRAEMVFGEVTWDSWELTDVQLTGLSPTGAALQPKRYFPVASLQPSVLMSSQAAGNSFPALIDGRYSLHVEAADVGDRWGNPLAGPLDYSFTVFRGDADGDADVDFEDLLAIAQNYGLTGRAASQGNVNFSSGGAVNFDDLLLAAQRYGTTLLRADARDRLKKSRGEAMSLVS